MPWPGTSRRGTLVAPHMRSRNTSASALRLWSLRTWTLSAANRLWLKVPRLRLNDAINGPCAFLEVALIPMGQRRVLSRNSWQRRVRRDWSSLLLPDAVHRGRTMMHNRRQRLALGLCCMLVLVSLVRCATVEESVRRHPKTVAGAAGGTLLGGMIFKSAGGTVVGGLLGGLAGGLIGNTMETQSKDRTTTVQDYYYTSTQGTAVRIEKVEVEPASIRPGEK